MNSVKHVVFVMLILLQTLCFVFAENKTALIIANGNYSYFSRLSNPVPEARQLKAALQRLGFQVILKTDSSKEEMLDALYDFENDIKKRGGIALFHYGGHAVQVDGKNYLIPADANIPDERRAGTRAVDAEEIMATLEASGSDTNIVILDSCRNNPLPGGGRSGTRGLAVAGRKPKNSIIVYSAESGTVARDGVFTPTLLEYLEIPGMSFIDILRQTRRGVYDKTGGEQTPGSYDQLFEPVYLAGTGALSETNRQPGFSVEQSYGAVKARVVTSGTLYLDSQRQGWVDAGSAANLTDLAAGIHSLEMQYPDGKKEIKTVTVVSDRTETIAFIYARQQLGNASISAVTSGSVYINGVYKGYISGGNSKSFQDMETGTYTFEMRYPDGKEEEKTLSIVEDRTITGAFMYKTPARIPDNFVLIEAGTFTMGSPESEPGRGRDEGRHTVTISKDFYTAKYEVTQAEFKSVMGTNPADPNVGIGDSLPANNVSWNAAIEYCNKLSEKEGLTPCYSGNKDNFSCNFSANGYRLPTEAEWEFTARGGNKSHGYIYAGSNSIDSIAWYKDNSGGKTQPVGRKQANELGVYDMAGNIWEWCWDFRGGYPTRSVTDPKGPATGSTHIIRGGSWGLEAKHCRLAKRIFDWPPRGSNGTNYFFGFRVVRTAE